MLEAFQIPALYFVNFTILTYIEARRQNTENLKPEQKMFTIEICFLNRNFLYISRVP